MRCLVVADLHYSLPQFDWLLAAAPEFDVVIFRRRRARHRLVRRFPRADPGGEEISVAAVRHDAGHSLLGQSRPRRTQRGRRKDRALGRRYQRTRHRLRRRQPHHRRHALHGVSVVGRAAGQEPHRSPASRRAAERAQRWIWVHHAPPANSPTSWGGKRFFGDVELVQWIAQYQPSMVISGHVHQSPFIPDGSWFDRLGDHLGLQHRPAARPPAGLYRARPR